MTSLHYLTLHLKTEKFKFETNLKNKRPEIYNAGGANVKSIWRLEENRETLLWKMLD